MIGEPDILIIGLGSEILGDDGIGLKLVSDLSMCVLNPTVDFKTEICGGFELLEAVRNYHTVFFIDATKTGATPGSVFLYGINDYLETLHLSNFHEMSFTQMFELGTEVGYHMPEHIRVIAVEVLNDTDFTDALSNELSIKYDEILNKVAKLIQYELKNNHTMIEIHKKGFV